MKAGYETMGRAELESALRRLTAELEDLEETLQFNFKFTSSHISGGQVRKDEDALRALREEVEEVKGLLGLKN